MAKSSQPTYPVVPLPVWRELLDAALAFRAAKPWERRHDNDLFALIDDQQRPWFPSVLGAAGQVFGVVLYRGEAGLRFLFENVQTLPGNDPDLGFLQDALMLDWGAKKALVPEEIALLAQLGYTPKPRERQAWPCFRTHTPGLYPWSLNETEARELTLGLRATLACLLFADTRPYFFMPGEERSDLLPTVLMRDALAGPLQPEQVEWRQWQLPAPASPASPQPSPRWLAELKALPQEKGSLMEFDQFYMFTPILEDGRPYFPRMALVVDGGTGFIYGMETVSPKTSWGDIVLAVWSKALLSARARPEFIAIGQGPWLSSLKPLASALGIKLLLNEKLPFIAEARASLRQFSQ